MLKKFWKKIGISLIATVVISLILIPSSYAQGITLDGDINESDWVLWFEDNDIPKYTAYYSLDDTNVYIGILLDDNDVTNDKVMFAFKAENYDWLIEIIQGTTFVYRPSGGGWNGWWQSKRPGLPPDVQVEVGTTNGKTSYEICIPKNMLGGYAEDFPEKAKIWIMYRTEDSGNVNYYPQGYADWFFVTSERNFVLEEEEPPKFSTPEIPYGTVLSVATMIAALMLYTRRNKLPNF